MKNNNNYSDLFSSITTLFILVLLYFPPRFAFSPVLFSTFILLLYLLRLGAAQISDATNTELCSTREIEEFIDSGTDSSFVEWNVRAPLEVIYEEGEENDSNLLQRYPSLSLFYPGDSSSEGDWDDDENMRFRWEENLIEIALDDHKNKCNDVVADEDNLIEIDLSPASLTSGKIH